MSGFTSWGSPPKAATASRMEAKSAMTGTPVKSWNSTREGMNATSGPTSPARPASTTAAAAFWAAAASPCSRMTFSSRILRV